jgi:nitrile hydratase accessory protein
VALHEKLGFPWQDFQRELIAAIRDWEAGQDDVSRWSYYERWLAALEVLAEQQGWVSTDELDARTNSVLAQPATQNHHHAMREPVAVVSGGAST